MKPVPVRDEAPALSTRVRLLPIIFFMVYLNLTVLLFAVGPWDYHLQNPVEFYAFLIAAHGALLAGYLSAAFREPCTYDHRWPIKRLIFISIVVNLALLIPTSLFRTGKWYPDILSGIENPGLAYAISEDLRETGNPVIEYIRFFAGPLLFMALPLSIFYWRRLSNLVRTFAVISIAGTVALFIAMGTNKAIADTVLLVPWVLTAARFAGVLKFSKKQVLALGIASVVSLLLFVAFFAATMATRPGSVASTGVFNSAGSSVDDDNFLIRDLSPETKIGFVGLDLYLTSGYYALSLALQEPWVPTFGVGNSFFLTRQAARITGNHAIEEMSYPARIEKYGWDSVALWSSIYPWLASDLSFPGTIVAVFFVGRLFAMSWLDTLRAANPFAVLVFSLFIIMLFYFPANNQVLQFGEGLSAFYVIIWMWFSTRRKDVGVSSFDPLKEA
jgi:hypothetical protein